MAGTRRWHALWVSQAAAFMTLLDVSIVNVALPSIQRDLAASPSMVQWVVSGYALTFGLALVPAGRLGDIIGRRRMFLIGLSSFIVTSALTGAAPTIELVILARLLQGVAGGVLVPQNSGLIQELFQGAERGRAFGILGATVGVATATGPVVGGLVLTVFTGSDAWRWVFYINVPVGAVALLLAIRILPAMHHDRTAGSRLDLVGSLLLGGGVLTLLLPVVNAESGGFGALSWLLLVCLALFALFAWWESRLSRRGGQPLLDPRLLRLPGYAAGSLIGLVYFTGFSGVLLVLALYLQHGLGYTPLESGLAVTPFALGLAVTAALAGRVVTRVGRWLTVTGLAANILAMVATAFLLRETSAWWAVLPLLVGGAGGGMVTSPNITLTLQHVPVGMAGAAGGALQTAQRIGTAIGAALLSTIFYQQLTRRHNDYHAAIFDVLLCAAAVMAVALILASVDLARHVRRAAAVSDAVSRTT
jgi:EmrB/QacA subfamily drug resistance transporter